MGVNTGIYTFGQKLGNFLLVLLIVLLGVGGTLLVVKFKGLAYLTITSIMGLALIGLFVLFYLLLFIELGKKQILTIKVSIFISLFFISFVIFTNLIETGILNMDFIFNLFK